jgi:hypothetical protein
MPWLLLFDLQKNELHSFVVGWIASAHRTSYDTEKQY